jgi:hypothetical protein
MFEVPVTTVFKSTSCFQKINVIFFCSISATYLVSVIPNEDFLLFWSAVNECLQKMTLVLFIIKPLNRVKLNSTAKKFCQQINVLWEKEFIALNFVFLKVYFFVKTWEKPLVCKQTADSLRCAGIPVAIRHCQAATVQEVIAVFSGNQCRSEV